MKYHIDKPWIHIQIDNLFHNRTIFDILQFYKQSKKNRYLYMQGNQILLNQQKVPMNTMVKQGDRLSLSVFHDMSCRVTTKSYPLEVVYEDDFLLIVNKEPHLLVHEDGSGEISLCDYVQAYYTKTNQHIPARPIHRLDKDTSGLVMFSKCSFFQPYFDELLNQKRIHREYQAIVEGTLPLHQPITIHQPIGRDRHNAKKQRISDTGKDAVTIICCQQHVHSNSLVHCTLKTGRTHQIRVHLAHIHHPILGDLLYGHDSHEYPRLALHACKLTWVHPITQKQMTVSIDLPDDLQIASNRVEE